MCMETFQFKCKKNNYFYRFEETDTYSGTCRAGKGNFTV